MPTLLMIIFLGLLNFGCQTSPLSQKLNNSRNLANVEVWKKFIQNFAKQANMTEENVEQAIIQYLKQKPKEAKYSHASLAGLTDDQLKGLDNLSQTSPYTNEIRRWSLENIDLVFPKVKNINLKSLYQTVVIEKRGIINPYSYKTRKKLVARKRKLLLKDSLIQGNKHTLDEINLLKSQKSKESHRKTLSEFKDRGKSEPEVYVNGQKIIRYAVMVEKKSGLKGAGVGCEDFAKTVSAKALQNKAMVDAYRAELIEQMAYNKNNGRQFASIDEVPPALRLTNTEIDQATVIAFQDVLKIKDDKRAKAIVKKLKSRRCRIY